MRIPVPARLLSTALAVAAFGAHAQPAPPSPGIYTCTDARGRTLTADRPIADCLDREQRELGPSGTTRRKLEPSYSAREQAEREERARQAELQRLRALEERRRERALLARFPNVAAHERERGEALAQIDVVTQAARKRLDELRGERQRIDEELEFYVKDPSKAPDSLRRKQDDNLKSVAVQNRFIGEQEDEKRRVNQRFDEEQMRLRPLWAGGPAAPAAAR
ncbi:conserved exported hypothetical protein [Burkholderiales bacterium 8X]|nr:conserved exported hypothetical protein [Burkholderiales bacterium 8X]